MQCVCQRRTAPALDPGEAFVIKYEAHSTPLPGKRLAAAPADFGRFAASYEWLISCCASLSRRITSPSVVWAKSA
jgi:hypothetical protein